MTNRSRTRSTRAFHASRGVLALAATFAALTLTAAGCLLTSSFDNIAGVRPQDSGAQDAQDEAFEAGDDAEADTTPPKGFCASQTAPRVICTEFDDGALTAGGWTVSVTKDAGSATIDMAQ